MGLDCFLNLPIIPLMWFCAQYGFHGVLTYLSLRANFGMFTHIYSCKWWRLVPSEVDKLVCVRFQLLPFQLEFWFVAVGLVPGAPIYKHFSTEVLG